ncbi:NAD(P)/FAD-dependent oxidoreductase [Celeribacter persicus]|uniref:3-phenylpropionate/trans-cinnamate dioxygenase ferredoxin reductase subunit n=1 Tax=Celeribacter persicus TaxID=1651082 RepID=A0A2T5HUR3_9RHOB|nr:FAD/NAD(P)-binding oxidoreductase [Celeribacter persicus]PTQ75295.1 3-phenylpropionate/trans-cinnamate dioxygenase ferredoxin reductase subunit [Celeribacter persicus]
MYSDGFVIVGASYAGVSFALHARKLGYTGPITIFTEEANVAYDVPSISKKLLPGTGDVPVFKSPILLEKADITVRAQTSVTAIDRVDRAITLSTGERVPFDYLVLATGTKAVVPPLFDGLSGVYVLKTLEDGERLLAALDVATRIAVIGGGVLGVEAAYGLRQRGLEVVLYERAPACLGRQVSPGLSTRIEDKLSAEGVVLYPGTSPDTARTEGNGIVLGTMGVESRFDAVLVCAGARPNTDLALQSRLPSAQGILIDRWFRTGDHHILAVGDCIEPEEDSTFEMNCLSVQHATETGKQAAEALIRDIPARPVVPTFWSALGEDMIKMAGYYDQRTSVDPAPDSPGHAATQSRDGTLRFVEALNDNMAYVKALKDMKT